MSRCLYYRRSLHQMPFSSGLYVTNSYDIRIGKLRIVFSRGWLAPDGTCRKTMCTRSLGWNIRCTNTYIITERSCTWCFELTKWQHQLVPPHRVCTMYSGSLNWPSECRQSLNHFYCFSSLSSFEEDVCSTPHHLESVIPLISSCELFCLHRWTLDSVARLAYFTSLFTVI